MLETLLSVGAEPSVLNPKVSLLQRMTRSARGQWLVVSDSNVRVAPSYVEDALAQAEPDVGLITHLVAGGGGHGLGACLERLQLNAMIAPGICGARFLVGRTCVVGKSMFIRVDALRAIGGFRSAGGFLAEDYQLGCAIEKAGYRVVLANTPIMAWHPSWTIEKFVRRHLRWSIMRRKISPMGYCLEVFLNPGPFFLVLLALAVCLPDSPLDARWAALGFIAAQGLAALTSGTLSGPKTMALALVVNPLRECFSLALWVAGWWASRIEWRGKSYWVGPGTRLTEERHDSPKGVGDEA